MVFVASLLQTYGFVYITNDIIFIQNFQVLDPAEARPREPQSFEREGACNSRIFISVARDSAKRCRAS